MSRKMLDIKRISVLIAVRNEANHISSTLDMLKKQDYPKEQLEIIIIDGCSIDDTVQIAENYRDSFEHFKIIRNHKILSASGWNMGIASATGDVVSILSGHVLLPPDYYSKMVKYLTSNVAGVGGRAMPCGFDKRSDQISKAFRSRLGSGGATYICSNKNMVAETISFGCYWKKILQDIGGFDETIVRGQDWDLNIRLRKQGYKLFFVADVEVIFFTRSKLSSLWKRQYLAGLWKLYINRKSRKHTLPRHIIPGVFSLVFTLLVFLCFFNSTFFLMFIVFFGVYLSVVFYENFSNKMPFVNYPIMFIIYFTIHYAYGLGMLMGVGKIGLTKILGKVGYHAGAAGGVGPG